MEIPGRPSMRDTQAAQSDQPADQCGPMPNPVTERARYIAWHECKAGIKPMPPKGEALGE